MTRASSRKQTKKKTKHDHHHTNTKNTAFFGGAADDEIWLQGAVEMVRRADAVLCINGWQKSEGARREVDAARSKISIPLGLSEFGAGASLIWPRAGLRLTASALNLTATQSWDFSDWPLPGRTVFLALSYDSTGAADVDAPGPQPFGNL